MRTFLWVVLGVNQIALLMQVALRLQGFEVTEFELRRRLSHHTKSEAVLFRLIYKNIERLKALQMSLVALLLVASAVLFTHLSGPLLGALYALTSFLVIVGFSRIQYLRNYTYGLFLKGAAGVVRVANILAPLWLITGLPSRTESALPQSYEEFLDQLRRMPSTVLKPLQRQRLESILASEKKTVKDIMTVRKRLVSVEPNATLGPVLLSDLQKSGHGYFPVVEKEGELEGVLTLADVGDIHTAKNHAKVRDIMSTHIVWVEESTSLYELTAAILQEKQYLVFVRNDDGQLSGVVTIADLMKHLLGIVKES